MGSSERSKGLRSELEHYDVSEEAPAVPESAEAGGGRRRGGDRGGRGDGGG